MTAGIGSEKPMKEEGIMKKKLIAWLPLLTLWPLLAFTSWEMDFDELWTAGRKTFNLLSIPNCELWLDASDSSTVIADGTAVTNWLDKSTAKNNAVAIGADNTRPTAYPAEQNGLCTIGFDGGDYLATGYHSSASQTVFFVALRNGGEAAFGVYGSNTLRSYFGATLSPTDRIRAAIGSDSYGYGSKAWGLSYGCVAAHYDGSNVYIRYNGAADSNWAQTGSGANPTYGYYIGALNNQGNRAIPWIGNLAEILVYSRVLDAAEIEQVEAYLMDKWGIE